MYIILYIYYILRFLRFIGLDCLSVIFRPTLRSQHYPPTPSGIFLTSLAFSNELIRKSGCLGYDACICLLCRTTKMVKLPEVQKTAIGICHTM